VRYDAKDPLKQHVKTEGHKKTVRARAYKTCTSIGKYFALKRPSLGDIMAAGAVAETFRGIKQHFRYKASDCGSTFDRVVCADFSVAIKIQLGRTKREKITENVLGPN